MALTPEDIHNKTFTPTRMKPGYDQLEVDDFLDGIEETVASLLNEVADLRSATRGEIPASITAKIDELTAENEQLKTALNSTRGELESARASHEQALAAAVSQSSGDSEQLVAQLNATQQDLADTASQLSNAQNENQQLNARIEELTAQVEQLGARNNELEQSAQSGQGVIESNPSESAVRMLELAQRTADEHVANARVESEAILNTATSDADRLLSDTKATVASITREFEVQKATFERKIEELRAYEREYRGRLRSYLEGQLSELETRRLDIDAITDGSANHED